MSKNPVLKSIRSVVKKSRFVRINQENLSNFCKSFELKEKKFWLEVAPFEIPEFDRERQLSFLFLLSSLLFCFWGKPKWKVKYKGSFYDGAWGLIAAFLKAIEKGFSILDWKYLAKIPESDLREIFKGNVEIPLFKERLKILRENGKILIEKFEGKVSNLLKEGKSDALRILNLITKNFPSFNDFAIYKGCKVFFHKKAQLFIRDANEVLKRIGFEGLKNVDQITAFGDYKIPWILRKFGILEYSPELAKKIDNRIEIKAGSEEEIEIRANAIWAIELMKREIQKKIPKISAPDIDSWLWLKSQQKSPDDKPYHLTRTIFY